MNLGGLMGLSHPWNAAAADAGLMTVPDDASFRLMGYAPDSNFTSGTKLIKAEWDTINRKQ
jgi:hypothetical protein